MHTHISQSAHGEIVTVVSNGYNNLNSNPGQANTLGKGKHTNFLSLPMGK